MTEDFLSVMSTDETPGDLEQVLKSFIRKWKAERARNKHLYSLLKERTYHPRRVHRKMKDLESLVEAEWGGTI